EQIPDLLTNESPEDDFTFVIKRLNDSDWRIISPHVGDKLSFNTIMALCKDSSFAPQRLSTLIQNSIQSKSIMPNLIPYVSCWRELSEFDFYFPQESKYLFLEQIKPNFLEQLDSISSENCGKYAVSYFLDMLFRFYPEDKQIIDRLATYLVKNNFKHLKQSTATQVVELLMQGLTHQDGAKIRAADKLYSQDDAPNRKVLQWFKPKKEGLTLDACLPDSLKDKVTILLNQNQEKPGLI
ncbi:MAG: hypothetical protein ACOYKA_04730, partial [Legionellaceae bacterium]